MVQKKTKKILLGASIFVLLCITSILIIVWALGENDPEWVNPWGGDLNDWGHDVGIDSEDNVFVVGDTANYGEGEEDVVLINFDKEGKEIWKKTWGGTEFDNGWGMTLDSDDNIYITGWTKSFGKGNEDIILLKYSNAGGLKLNTTWGYTGSDIGHEIAVDSEGNIFVVGSTRGDNNETYSNTVLIKFNNTGFQQWNTSWGFEYTEVARGIAIDSSDNIYVVGYGWSYENSVYSYYIILLKYSNNGNLLWDIEWGENSYNNYGYDVIIDSNDNIYVTGMYSDEMVLIKFDSNGNEIWYKTKSGTGVGIALDSEENVYIVGDKYDSYGSNYDIILYKFDSEGTEIMYNTWENNGIEHGENIAIDSDDKSYIIGTIQPSDEEPTDMILIKNLPPHIDEGIFILIAALILIIPLSAFTYFIVIKPYRSKLKSVRQRVITDFPKDLTSTLTSDEIVLFQSNGLINKRVEKIKKRGYGIFCAGIIAFFFFFVLWLWADSLIKEGITFSFSLALIFPILVTIVIFPLLFKKMSQISKQNQYFVVTNKKIGIYTYSYEEKTEWINSIKLSNIRGLVFKKRKWDERGDYGTIEIFEEEEREEEDTSYFILKNVPKFRSFQIILESILNEYGNIKERWERAKKNPNYLLPFKIEVSSKKLEEIALTQKKYTKISILFPLITFIVAVILSFGSIYGGIWFYFVFLMTIIMGPYLAISVPLLTVRDKKKMKRRSSSKNSSLTINNDSIIFSDGNSIKNILIDKNITISYLKINKPSNTLIKWNDNIDAISIKKTYDSSVEFNFGPIEKFPEIYEYCFIYLIVKKAEKGLLKSKDELIKEKTIKTVLSTEKGEKPERLEKDHLSKKTLTSLESIPRTDERTLPFQNYLNPNEEILLYFKPQIKYTKKVITIFVGVIGFVLSIVFMVFSFSSPYGMIFFIIPLLIMVVFMMCCIVSLFIFPGTKIHKNSSFLFTNQKILAKYANRFIFTRYNNIQSITKAGIKLKKYDIHIYLKRAIEESPFLNKYAIFISTVEIDHYLYDQIKGLNDKFGQELNDFMRFKS